MEIIRIRVTLDGEKTALSSLSAIDAKINEINKKKVSVNINTKEADGAKNAMDGMGAAAGNAAGKTKLLGDALSMIKFTAIAAAIGGVTVAFKNAVAEMKAVDTQLTNIQKVSGMTKAELGTLGDAAYATASQYGVAADEYLSAVYTFQKAGLGDSAAQLGELATKTMLVGDTTADVASKFLIATNAAWGMEGNMTKLSSVVDQADYINNNYATSLDKLAAAMPIVASTSANLGMSVEETMAVIGTITSITQETGTKAATAWRALAMNITGELGTIYDESGEAIEVTEESVKSISDAMKIYGNEAVKAAQQTGQIINPMEAVNSLAQAYRDGLLTDIELQNILMSVGGKLRTNQLTALVKDLASDTSIYREMLEGLGEAAGTADSEISIMLSSWESKTAILKNTWTEFVQKSISSDAIKGLLDGLTSLIDGMDNLGLAASNLGGIMLTLFSGRIASGITASVKSIKDLAAAFKAGLTGAQGLQAALLGIGIAATAISAVSMALKQMDENQLAAAQSAYESATSAAQAYQEQNDQLYELVQSYRELASDGISTDELAQVQSIQDQINGLIGDQYTAVDLVNGAYEEQIGLLVDIQGQIQAATRAELVRAQAAAARVLQEQADNVFGNGRVMRLTNWRTSGAEMSEYQSMTSDLTSLHNADSQGIVRIPTNADEIVQWYNDVTTAIDRYTEAYDGNVEALSKNDIYAKLTEYASEFQSAVENYQAAMEAENGDIGKENEAAETFGDALSDMADEANEAASTVESAVGRIAAAKAQLDSDLANGPSEDTAFNSVADVYKDFMEEVESGRINSNAFWKDAEFLLGPEVMAEIGNNYEDVVQAIEDSMIGEVFAGANGNATDFVETLIAAADAEGNIADGAATITETADGYEFMVNDVGALADAWGMTKDEVYAALEALEAYGALNWSDNDLVEHVQNLGVALNEAGQFDFSTLTAGLEAAGMSATQIQATVDQLSAMGMVDMGDTSSEIDNVTTAAEGAQTAADDTKSSIEEIDSTSQANAQGQFEQTAAAADQTTGAAQQTASSIMFVNQQSLGSVIGQAAGLAGTIQGATSSAYSLRSALSALDGMTVTTYVNTVESTTKLAEGTDNAPGGPALVGDEYSPSGQPRPELVMDHGNTYLAGKNGPEIVNLRPGAKVFTYDETKAILSGQIPAFAVGGIYKRSGSSSGGSSSSGSSYSSSSGGGSSYSGGSSSGSVSSSVESAEAVSEEWLDQLQDAWDTHFKRWEFKIFDDEKRGASNSQLKKSYEYILKGTEEAIQQFRDAGVDEYDDRIMNLKKQYWSYSDEIKKLEEEDEKSAEEAAKAAEEAAEKKKKAYEDAIKAIVDTANEKLDDIDHSVYLMQQNGTDTAAALVKEYNKAMSEIEKAIKKLKAKGLKENADEIQKLEKQWWGYKDAVVKVQADLMSELTAAVKAQLDDAAKVRDEKIQAIRDAADAQEKADAIAEKRQAALDAAMGLQNASKQRTVRIYNAKTGQWQWVADASAVASAQEALTSANKALAEETAAQAREKQIAAIEEKYDKLEAQYETLLASLEDPERSVSQIVADIKKNGTSSQKSTANSATALSKNISNAILSINKTKPASVNGSQIMYGASSSSSTSQATTTAAKAGSGTSYYINGVEISEARAKTMTVAQLAKDLATLSIYNRS